MSIKPNISQEKTHKKAVLRHVLFEDGILDIILTCKLESPTVFFI